MTRHVPFARMRTYLQDQVELSGGVTAWSEAHGIPKSTVSEVISEKRKMPETIINALGFSVVKVCIPLRGQNV